MPVSHRGILWISSDEMIEWGAKINIALTNLVNDCGHQEL